MKKYTLKEVLIDLYGSIVFIVSLLLLLASGAVMLLAVDHIRTGQPIEAMASMLIAAGAATLSIMLIRQIRVEQ